MTVTATDARQQLFGLIGTVNQDRSVVRITSRKGNAVLLSEDDYDSLQETAYLFRSPANVRRLLAADDAIRGGQGVQIELDRA